MQLAPLARPAPEVLVALEARYVSGECGSVGWGLVHLLLSWEWWCERLILCLAATELAEP